MTQEEMIAKMIGKLIGESKKPKTVEEQLIELESTVVAILEATALAMMEIDKRFERTEGALTSLMAFTLPDYVKEKIAKEFEKRKDPKGKGPTKDDIIRMLTRDDQEV